MAQPLEILYKEIGISPKETSYYKAAFTHPSIKVDLKEEVEDYQRLEFLGDSLIGLVVSELCFMLYPDYEAGTLAEIKASTIRTSSEAAFGKLLGLERFILMGSSYSKCKVSDHVMEDIFESFIGALLLDQGLDFTHKFLWDFLIDKIKEADLRSIHSPKSALQEYMQSTEKRLVEYRTLEVTGPAHDPCFLVGVYFDEEELARGEGHTKKEAEVNAAKNALSKLAVNTEAK